MLKRLIPMLILVILPPALTAGEVEATSLLGRPLERPTLSEEAAIGFENRLAEVEAALAADQLDHEAAVWKGRYLAYLGRHRDAIAWYGEALQRFPDDPELLRHRGHRWITVRRFDRAVEDLARASELLRFSPDRIEPDGLPNRLGLPRSTLKFNVEYHLALAHYLLGENEAALDASDRCAGPARRNDDVYVAWANWRYHILRRLGRDEEAAALAASVPERLNLIENGDYHALLRAYAPGDAKPLPDPLAEGGGVGEATRAYGLAAYLLAQGDRDEAWARMSRIAALDGWAAFGVIAAEADLARLGSDSEPAER